MRRIFGVRVRKEQRDAEDSVLSFQCEMLIINVCCFI